MISSLENFSRIDLQTQSHSTMRKIYNENHRYAAYIYMGLQEGKRYDGDEQGILLSSIYTQHDRIPSKFHPCLDKITANFKDIGFEIDNEGNYYHTDSGTIFNLIYDTERKEIIIGFMGLNQHSRLRVDEETQKKLSYSSYSEAARDWMGSVPSSVAQTILIGKILKKATQNTQLTPVVIGHSHGGGLAQTTALANDFKAVIFNPRPLGAGTRAAFEAIADINERISKITAFCVKGDWLTDSPNINWVGSWAESLGMRVPRIMGKTYYLPALEKEDAHGSYYQAFEELRKSFKYQ